MKFLKRLPFLPLLAFVIPSLLMALALAANGIWLGSDITPLASDAYHQTLPAYSLIGQILHGKGGLFYTFTSGLGLNLMSFFAWHVGSPFVALAAFSDLSHMPDAVYLSELMKFGTIGLSAFTAFSHMYKRINRWFILSFSTAWALVSFITSQNEILPWQDVMILAPLIVWGLHQLQDDGKRGLYYSALLALFVFNYYFGFFMAIFITLYGVARLFLRADSWRARARKYADFVLTSLLSAVSAAFVLLPVVLDLRTNGQGFTNITSLWTDNSWGLDFFAKNFVGSYDTTQYQAVPMIYVGLLPLIFALLFFLIRQIRWQAKLAFGLLTAFILASFYFQWLDLAWQAFHAPNMFLHRYSWLFSLLIVLLALEAASRLARIKYWMMAASIGFLALGFLGTLYYGAHYKYVTLSLFGITLLFLTAHALLLFGRRKKWLSPKLFVGLLLLFVSVEVGVNTYYEILGVKNQWNYPSRTYYTQTVNRVEPAVSAAEKLLLSQAFRMDNTNPDTQNDGMKYGYNSIGQFSSVRNSHSSAVMSALGFSTDGHYLNLRYPGNTLLMDSIFAETFNITSTQPAKYGFTTPKNAPFNLTQNAYAQSLGIFVPGGYNDATFLNSADSVANQTAFVNHLAKADNTYFRALTASSASNNVHNTSFGREMYTGIDNTVTIHYTLDVPADSQAYLELTGVVLANPTNQQVTVSADNQTYSVSVNNFGSFYNLGYFAKAKTIAVTLSFGEQSSVSLDTPRFWALDIPTYTDTLATLSTNSVSAKTSADSVTLSTNNTSAGDLFLTVPYDKGWSATVDSVKTPISRAQSGFMKLHLAPGKHTVTLHFLPNGFLIGLALSALGALLFIFYTMRTHKKRSKS
jgi:uncharacterized membrane protein YfhO